MPEHFVNACMVVHRCTLTIASTERAQECAPVKRDVRPLDAMVTAIRIQWLPKSRNPASIGDGSRGNGTAGTEYIASAVRAAANAVVGALAHLGVTNIDIPITAPNVWAVLKDNSVALCMQSGARIDFPLQ